MKYFVWDSRYQDGLCALGALENVPKDEQILKGKPRAVGFPPDASYSMRADFPKDVEVPDNVYAAIHYVVSARLRGVLEPMLGSSHVEFLPVTIKNHKGRVVEGEYFVLNPTDVLDAIDVAASSGKLNDLDPTQLCMTRRLVIKPLPDDVTMFRPHNWARLLLVREDLVEKLKASGLKGLVLRDPDKFKG